MRKLEKKKRKEESCDDKFIIGAVGRLAHQKNPYFAIDVIEHVIKNKEDVVFWWIGSGGLDADVKEYVSKKGLTGKIRLFGSRKDVPELYQAMDLFFLPSKFEGFGLACLEAEAAGLPCVISTEFPNEINVTGDVIQIPLEKSSEEWASIIESMERRTNREEGFHIVNKSVYCDKVSGEKLAAFYCKAINMSCGERK
jgi:glycosyltransferase EpsF